MKGKVPGHKVIAISWPRLVIGFSNMGEESAFVEDLTYGKHEYLLLCTTLRVVLFYIKEPGRPVPIGTVSCQLCQGFRMAVTWWGHHVTGLGFSAWQAQTLSIFLREGPPLRINSPHCQCLTCYQESVAQRI